jgi:hypothetical protein
MTIRWFGKVLEDIEEEMIDKKSRRKVCEKTEQTVDLLCINLHRTDIMLTEKDKSCTKSFEQFFTNILAPRPDF